MKKALFVSFLSFSSFAHLFPENIYERNEDVRILKNKIESIKNRSNLNNQLLYSPKLDIQNFFSFSKDNSNSPLYNFDTFKNSQLKLSLNKQFKNGIQTEAGHIYQVNQLSDVEFLKVSDFSYTDKSNSKSQTLTPFLSFQLPFYKNRNGEINKTLEQFNDLTLNTEYLSTSIEKDSTIYFIDQIISEYLILKHRLKSTKSSLERTNKIFINVKRRVDLNIEELNSLLQVKALKESTEAELLGLSALEKDFEEKIQKLEIPMDIVNLYSSKDVNELQLFLMQKLPETNQNAKKAQTLLEEKTSQLNAIGSTLKALESKPEFNLNVKLSNNASGNNLSNATKAYGKVKQPEVIVGILFNMDLDRESKNKLINSYQEIAKLDVQKSLRALKNNSDELELLLTRLKSKHNVFSKYKDVLKTQNDKLNYENKLLASGRSSVFQVLQYEQDLYRQELTQTQLLQELFALHNDLALFKY